MNTNITHGNLFECSKCDLFFKKQTGLLIISMRGLALNTWQESVIASKEHKSQSWSDMQITQAITGEYRNAVDDNVESWSWQNDGLHVSGVLFRLGGLIALHPKGPGDPTEVDRFHLQKPHGAEIKKCGSYKDLQRSFHRGLFY